MQYRKLGHVGLVSALGLGTMRLPLKDGSQGYTGISSGQADIKASIEIIQFAFNHGINYIDTAYNYLDGDSEKILGLALQRGYRENVILATKAPVWLYHEPDDFDRYLDEQLCRLGTDYVDVYLLHGLNERIWQRKVLQNNILQKLEKAKQTGKIRFIGFSFHDRLDVFKSIIDSYPYWDMCQIQHNYLDVKFQAGAVGLTYASEKEIGVSIMEPLKGGYLARVPQDIQAVFAAVNQKRSAVEWGLDYLWDKPEVGVVLSGMGSIAQVKENISYASRATVHMLSENEQSVYEKAKHALSVSSAIPCTGCAYCMHCKQRVAIPYNIFAYNIFCTTGDFDAASKYYREQVPAFGLTADACIACKKCEERCPQQLPISTLLKRISEFFGT